MAGNLEGFRLWDDWLDGSLAHLRNAQLLRTLRPTVWCNSSSEALVHHADLAAWVSGQEPVVRHYDHCANTVGAATAVPLRRADITDDVSSVRRYDSDRCSSCDGGRGGGGGGGGCAAVGDFNGASSPSASAPIREGGVGDVGGGRGGGYPQSREALVRVRLFSLNDYLGLASHPEVAEAAARAAKQVGMGPRSSALVAGYTHSHRQLEEGLAELKGTQDCLLFPTGFAANLAVMTSLSYAAPPTSGTDGSSSSSSSLAIFSDELNHASIIDGARLASRSAGSGGGGGGGAVQLHVYRHNDLGHLEVGCLFSMDGDFADLRGLAALRRRHPFLLAVDEAHGTLVCGEGGGGAAEATGVDLHIGTLSKAFGALGGFVACSGPMKQLLLNRGRAFVYSTSLPVPIVEAAAAALRVSKRESWRRTHVWSLVRRLGSGLGVPALSPVVPLVVGPEGPTLELSSMLLQEGLMHVPAIRPPTVPPGTCRLRVSLSAAHSYEDVDELIRLVRRSGVVLARLPHLLDPRAALPPCRTQSDGGDGPGSSAGLYGNGLERDGPYSRL
ncbi:hypothetical protein VOLCADRAFT_78219 [Volvox carteri f. nagariensis]|uniref:Aminotransferase class I/classII large domain-containing protein n=1 Tax=Volvox carteri f. nagariensis TaxID=3068 RepID=D8UK78_VOLCA|nr:uncharacterized protein VOLCADRAFT_78219 [Volvox carteri f. nagariensis]EFJ39865.1 hypothetical protein VOLCADRAFT_78219 [Volvox carteri f. nagariensis]|eukprot:XP_002959071.1 hypothetical protein VOLCADRAFT_78219 [Volvox carteri f. nagariensis]